MHRAPHDAVAAETCGDHAQTTVPGARETQDSAGGNGAADHSAGSGSSRWATARERARGPHAAVPAGRAGRPGRR
ncbi:hypothetical protein DSY14_12335 [Nocardiopsis sp. MG754419]|nr:hypothetical protein [Nocardiopsis sp. MG754419]